MLNKHLPAFHLRR